MDNSFDLRQILILVRFSFEISKIFFLFQYNTHLILVLLQSCSDSDADSVWETADVTLERGSNGLGLSIAGGESGGDISITRLAAGGAAKNDGRLQIGDILLKVSVDIVSQWLFNEFLIFNLKYIILFSCYDCHIIVELYINVAKETLDK